MDARNPTERRLAWEKKPLREPKQKANSEGSGGESS